MPSIRRLCPRLYTFDLGRFRIATLLDFAEARDGLGLSFAVGQPETVLRELAAANHIDADRYEHPFIPTLVDTGSVRILFDTGLGAPDGALLSCLQEIGIGPDDIDAVVLTHGHPDHIGGLIEGNRPVFAKARHVFGAAEYTFWMKGEGIRDARLKNRDLFVRTCTRLADQATFVEPGQQILPGITAIDAAGHSPGLMAFEVESEGHRLLIWSDTCLHYVVSIQHPEWHAHFDDDKERAVATRKRLLAMAADQRLLVAGHHMPFPGLGYVERTQNSFRWVPISYQVNL
jgi:glyoxylase-like metal-dependent hydrolase (beta-lactamase superfamily II)